MVENCLLYSRYYNNSTFQVHSCHVQAGPNIFYAAVVNEFKTTLSYVLLRQFTILTVMEKTVLKIIANLMVKVWGGAGHVIQATLLPPPADLHIDTELLDCIWTGT